MARIRKSNADTRMFQIIPTKEELKDVKKLKKKYGKKKCLIKEDQDPDLKFED